MRRPGRRLALRFRIASALRERRARVWAWAPAPLPEARPWEEALRPLVAPRASWVAGGGVRGLWRGPGLGRKLCGLWLLPGVLGGRGGGGRGGGHRLLWGLAFLSSLGGRRRGSLGGRRQGSLGGRRQGSLGQLGLRWR